ncbi:unnamed protein product [Prorocentrum cordatum]|uniref:Helicase-associated domain-containing protein n=1 Tax=Prorocentrum cordatum TaxID=2364126 RepID=A0ABN9XKF1_9DINO|nr:unnamed protein product [Polarella glacialis]
MRDHARTYWGMLRFHRCGRRHLRTSARCCRQPADVLQDLVEYRSAHGVLDIPADYVTADGFPLGEWADNQRKLYGGENMSDEQFKLLNDLGFVWDLGAAAWADAFKDFEAQRRRTPDARELAPSRSFTDAWVAPAPVARRAVRAATGGPARAPASSPAAVRRRIRLAPLQLRGGGARRRGPRISFLAQAGLTPRLHYDRRQVARGGAK